MCIPVVNRVLRSRKALSISNANELREYHNVPYVQQKGIKSILCSPIMVTPDGHHLFPANLNAMHGATPVMATTASARRESRAHVQPFQQAVLMGVIYLENNTQQGIFSESNHSAILRTIIDVSVENAKSFCSLNASYARFLPKQFLKLLGRRTVTHVVSGDYHRKNNGRVIHRHEKFLLHYRKHERSKEI
ncbi:hypothetical protein AKO1_007834 [Acrasis kona]|uniref:Uncharacterized protein n=1 Tax=Acrasis kona TaxID=1008807 RepID=A0AAW2YRX7_9EUKA